MEKYGEILDDMSISEDTRIENSVDNSNLNNTKSIRNKKEKIDNLNKYISDDEKGIICLIR